jgi:hypothetical protein
VFYRTGDGLYAISFSGSSGIGIGFGFSKKILLEEIVGYYFW